MDFTDKDTYQDIFDPHAYCEIYYGPKSGILVLDGFLDFALKKLCEAFTERGVRGRTLIDIGHGPTIYQDLSACEAFEEIIGADYTDRNREYYERSLRNEPGTFDWTTAIQKVCELEGKGMTVEEKRQKLQNTVKKTIKCDVLQSDPMEPLVLPQAQCVMTLGCLECACSDLDTYRRAVRNVASLLQVGGHLILTEILHCSSYLLGGKRFSCLLLTQESVRSAVVEAGFVIVDWEVIHREYNKEQYELCNHTSSVFVLARKERNVC